MREEKSGYGETIRKIERQNALMVEGKRDREREEQNVNVDRKGGMEEGRGKVEGRSKGKRGTERGKRKMFTEVRNEER